MHQWMCIIYYTIKDPDKMKALISWTESNNNKIFIEIMVECELGRSNIFTLQQDSP
jgi:hypothetical protein